MKAYSTDIEHQSEANTAFRRVLFTGPKMQLVVMCLQPGEEIGTEVHPDTDQFFRIEKGTAKVVFDQEIVELHEDQVIIVPASTRHNVVNPSVRKELRLYTIYAPPQHPDKTVHLTKEEAEAAEGVLA